MMIRERHIQIPFRYPPTRRTSASHESEEDEDPRGPSLTWTVEEEPQNAEGG